MMVYSAARARTRLGAFCGLGPLGALCGHLNVVWGGVGLRYR